MKYKKLKNIEIDQLTLIIKNIYKNISKEYQFDLYIPNYKIVKGINLAKREQIVNDTIKIYKTFHPTFKDETINQNIKYIFLNIITNKTAIQFNNMIIYIEIYKILYHIDMTSHIINLLSDPKQYPDNFAKIQSDLKKVKRFRKHHKNNLIGLKKIMCKKQSRFRYWITSLYIKNKTLTKMFTYFFLLADIEKVKLLQEDPELKDIFLNELDFFLFQNTTVSKVVKSLGIILYYEMLSFLQITRKNAQEYSSHLIYYLFNENINTYEFDKVVQFSSSMGFYPIFSASKKSKLTKEEKNFIYNKLLAQIKRYTDINQDIFRILFDSFIESPHIQFLHKYPQELFRKNSKYSSIIL